MRREDRESFARAVWDEFQKLSGQERCMSPAEFWVLSGWMDSDVPLPVILRAFGEFKGTPRKLEAMQTPVWKAYDYWFKALGGL